MATIPATSVHAKSARPERSSELVFRDLIRTLGLLERVMQPYFARFGISGAKWGVLRTLQRAESEGNVGIRMTELSERLLVRQPSITGLIDRLERDGLVARSAATDDLRAKEVRLTPQGHELLNRVLAGHPAQIDRLMSALNGQEKEEMHDKMMRLANHLEQMLQGPSLPAE